MDPDATEPYARTKRVIIAFFLCYSIVLFMLLLINTGTNSVFRTVLLMGFTLFVLWVVVGGSLQIRVRKKFAEKLSQQREHPICYFIIVATTFALVEEAIATTITNLAFTFGVPIGKAYITASTNYIDVVTLHSVIVFIPQFFMLGFLLKKYSISPFAAFLVYGLVGVFGEVTFSGSSAILNAPFWICVYGLMVYLPAHTFVSLKRKKISFLLYPLFIFIVAFSAIATAWIPASLHHPRLHFEEIK